MGVNLEWLCRTCLANQIGACMAPRSLLLPLSIQEQITMFNPEDFAFSLGGPEPEALVNGAQLRAVTLNQLPALDGQGISMALVNLDACGINLPHVHPRATEVSHMTGGECGSQVVRNREDA